MDRLWIIKFYIPNSRKDDSNGQEDKARYQNTAVVLLFSLAELTLAVIGISLVLRSAHRDKSEHSVPQNVANAYQRALAADI